MSEVQRVGQLFMVAGSTSGVDRSVASAVTGYHVGSVILMGDDPVSLNDVASVSTRLQRLAGPVGLLLATDQEGGQVQRLRGPGFSPMPSALEQGQLAPAVLQAEARTWGQQLHAAGVNLDLAPVMDTVPSPGYASANPPIGALDREFGYDPATVAAHGVAFARGLAEAGVGATLKHFPGLGRVTGNTDTTSGVTDPVTGPGDSYLAPFAAAVKAGAGFVMMSTAVYPRLDAAHPAAFSPAIIGGLLRGKLGFGGVVVSDDLGAAQQVASYPVAERAVDFVAAGGDIVLTVDAGQIPAMAGAVLARAQADPAFRALVDAAALRVLRAKQALGLA